MVDYSAGEISTEEAGELIRYLAEKLNRKNLFFYPGVSYRHVIVYNDDKTPHPAHEGKILPDDIILTPPHDITGERIRKFLPYGAGSSILLELMKNSVSLLENHPVNVRRAASGRRPANSIWIWSKAKKPKLDSFSEKHGIDGAVISAVDLVKGIGICAGLEPVSVIGATGNINTNFEGKARAALDQLKKGKDFVFIHIEAPDECSHQGNAKCKLMAIDAIDKKVVRPIDEEMQKSGFEYRIMILPDHPTPVALKTHTSEPVPFLIFDSAGPVGKEMFKGYIKKETDITEGSINYGSFDEFQAQKSGILVDPGYMLMNLFLRQ
jgi:2,3-bisphosphoglycerate-independent phosphoglycerate mutase